MLSLIYSGEWTLNDGASALIPVVAPVVESGYVRTDHHERRLHCIVSIAMDGEPMTQLEDSGRRLRCHGTVRELESKTTCGFDRAVSR